jgi:hypothetical protein
MLKGVEEMKWGNFISEFKQKTISIFICLPLLTLLNDKCHVLIWKYFLVEGEKNMSYENINKNKEASRIDTFHLHFLLSLPLNSELME